VTAEAGKAAFDANCSSCHGANGAGTDKGPPLIHDIYNPGHHADAAFVLAARKGVRRHHWPFGDMPPQPQVTDSQISAIIQYVRELQAANGISYRPHRM
jgi:mono/diheme cytochrome c family protein